LLRLGEGSGRKSSEGETKALRPIRQTCNMTLTTKIPTRSSKTTKSRNKKASGRETLLQDVRNHDSEERDGVCVWFEYMLLKANV
jgi:hypothetical protein